MHKKTSIVTQVKRLQTSLFSFLFWIKIHSTVWSIWNTSIHHWQHTTRLCRSVAMLCNNAHSTSMHLSMPVSVNNRDQSWALSPENIVTRLSHCSLFGFFSSQTMTSIRVVGLNSRFVKNQYRQERINWKWIQEQADDDLLSMRHAMQIVFIYSLLRTTTVVCFQFWYLGTSIAV